MKSWRDCKTVIHCVPNIPTLYTHHAVFYHLTSKRRELMTTTAPAAHRTGHWWVVQILVHFTTVFLVFVRFGLLKTSVNTQHYL